MNKMALVFGILVLGIFLIGCTSSQQSGYAAYNQPQGQQQGQYVGGGCGVAPNGDYENTPIGSLGSAELGAL